MTRRFRSTWLRASTSAVALTAGLVIAHAAAAQTSGAQAAAAPADQGGDAVVTVTAERRAVNIQTAPTPATVLTGSQLQQKGVTGIDELQFTTPDVTINNFGQGNDFNIRGIGKDATNIQTPSGVGIYWDGVAGFPSFFQGEPYYDIANVEIERGPQGTFGGLNETGGAVYITTENPNFSGQHGYIQAGYGNYNDVDVQGAVNLPLSDTLAIRLSADAERRDSYYNVIGVHTGDPGELQLANFRLGILWQPSPQLKILFKSDYTYDDNGGYPGSFPNSPLDPLTVQDNGPNTAVDQFIRNSLNISYTFADGIVLRSISGYQTGRTDWKADIDGTLAANDTFTDHGNETIYSEEVNLLSPDRGQFRWILGAFYQHDDVDIPEGGFDIGFPPGVFDIDLIYNTPKVVEAGFGQGTLELGDGFELQAGARYTYSTFDLFANNYIDGITTPPFGAISTGHETSSRVTGKVALNWKLDPNNFLYAFVATGLKAGGINTNPVNGQTEPSVFNPEYVTDYEIGWKPTFFDGHLRMQFDGFYTQYQNFQFSFATNAGASASIQNVPGTTTIEGVEAEGQAVFGQLSFDASAAYLYSRIGQLIAVDPTGRFGGLPHSFAGAQEPEAPQWTFNVSGQYVFELANGGTLTPRLSYAYIDSQWTTPFEDQGDFLKARNLVNAQISYDKGPYDFTLYGTNLLNEHYLVIASATAIGFAGAPLEFGLRLSRKF